MDIKLKLSSYYSDLLNQISSFSSEKSKEYKLINYKNIDSLKLFEHIKNMIKLLIELKISEVTSNMKNNSNYFQIENYSKKLEQDIRKMLQQIFEYKIQNNAMEEKIKIYKLVQKDYEELKEKVKFFGGKFLDNERKENEILILRQENEILKKELSKFDKMNDLNESLKNNYITKINDLNQEIEQLKKKLETQFNINNYNTSNAPNVNININNSDNLLSKILYKPDINEMKKIISSHMTHKNNYKYLKGLKKIFQNNTFCNKKRKNNNIIKSIYLNSNNNIKYNINSSSPNTSGKNIYTSNYNKINSQERIKRTKSKNKMRKNRNLISMKIEKEESNRSSSMNKFIRNLSNGRQSHKSDNKNKKIICKISSFKPIESCPLSCKNKGSSKVKKFMNTNFGINDCSTNNISRVKKSSSTMNIKIIQS